MCLRSYFLLPAAWQLLTDAQIFSTGVPVYNRPEQDDARAEASLPRIQLRPSASGAFRLRANFPKYARVGFAE